MTSHHAPQPNSDLTSEQALFDTSNPLQLLVLSQLLLLQRAPKAMLAHAVQDLIRQMCMTCASHGSAGYAVGNLVVDLTTSDGTWDATVIGLKALLSIVTAASSHPLSKKSPDVEVGLFTSRHLHHIPRAQPRRPETYAQASRQCCAFPLPRVIFCLIKRHELVAQPALSAVFRKRCCTLSIESNNAGHSLTVYLHRSYAMSIAPCGSWLVTVASMMFTEAIRTGLVS